MIHFFVALRKIILTVLLYVSHYFARASRTALILMRLKASYTHE